MSEQQHPLHNNAQQLIEENLQTKSPALDLGNCGLQGNEACLRLLAECTHLKTLIFSDTWRDWDATEQKYFEEQSNNKGTENCLKVIPENLPVSLEKLVLRDNEISEIKNLEALTRLKHLDLESNEIEKLENLEKLTELTHLYSRENYIEKLENLDTLTSLKVLDLSQNDITRIENLAALQNLMNLDLGGNSIPKIENLEVLPGLTRLDLGYAWIEKIENLEALTELTNLTLGHQITKIENLETLTKLTHLDLEENQIKKIENLGALKALTTFSITFNEIKKIENLDALKRLKSLYLGYNGIRKIENLGALKNLTSLGLAYNGIGKIENLEALQNLENLYMSFTGTTKIENLEGLKSLKSLGLMCNKITKIENLKALTELTYLNLHANKIEKIENLETLTKLENLRLDGNKITKIENLEPLTSVLELRLGGNDLGKIENLETLTTLKELDLGRAQITRIENLETLTKLEALELDGNEITHIDHLSMFTALTRLDLSNNKITNIENLEKLTRLNRLSLNKNKIEKIENLETLTALQELNLSENKIEKIENLETLTALLELNLSENDITRFENLAALFKLHKLELKKSQVEQIEPLPASAGLRELDLSENKLTRLENLESLKGLVELNLRKNKIARLENLRGLPRLKELDLIENDVSEITPFAAAACLQNLYLSENKITRIEALATLTGVTHLDLRSNQISEFAPALLDLPVLEDIYLDDNPLQNLPMEIATNSDALPRIRRYWEDTTQGKALVYQAKLILVGNGRVGKTSLVRRWLDNRFDPDESSTHAIQLRKHILSQLAETEGLEHVQLNVWDFGGQDIYHTTHRLFMQTQAVFLLVWDAVTQNVPSQTEILTDGSKAHYRNYPLLYWLNYAYTLGKKSPVLVVQTKAIRDGKQAPPQLTADLKKHYQVQQCLAIDAAIDNADENGINELSQTLQDVIRQAIARTCTTLPTSWWHTRQALETMQQQGSQILGREDFTELCVQHKVPAASEKVLLDYFHNSGFFFYREGLFHDQIILNQQWAIDAVYTLFDRAGMFMKHRNDGFFEGKDLCLGWKDKTEDEQELLVSFMETCELCADLDRPRSKCQVYIHKKPLPQRQFLAPQLLPDTPLPDQDKLFSAEAPGLYLKFCHSVLHMAVIHRFIIRNHYFASRENMRQRSILLNVEGNKVLVEAFPERNELLVRLSSRDHTLLNQVRNELKKIQADIDGINEWVSTDGKGYVTMESLQEHKNLPYIVADNETAYEIAGFQAFLHKDEEARFEQSSSFKS